MFMVLCTMSCANDVNGMNRKEQVLEPVKIQGKTGAFVNPGATAEDCELFEILNLNADVLNIVIRYYSPEIHDPLIWLGKNFNGKMLRLFIVHVKATPQFEETMNTLAYTLKEKLCVQFNSSCENITKDLRDILKGHGAAVCTY